MRKRFASVSCSFLSISFPRGAAGGIEAGEDGERVTLGVRDGCSGNGVILRRWRPFHSLESGGNMQVVDLIMDRSFVGGALEGGGGVGPEVT